MKLHLEVSKCVSFMFQEYVQHLRIKETVPSERVMGVLRFTKQLFYVGSFMNTFCNSQIWEKIHRFLRFPSESCAPQISDPDASVCGGWRMGASSAAPLRCATLPPELSSWQWLRGAGRAGAALSRWGGTRAAVRLEGFEERGLLCSSPFFLLYYLWKGQHIAIGALLIKWESYLKSSW